MTRWKVAGLSGRALGGGGTIFCFHSITTPELPAEGLAHVTLDAFRSLVGLARRVGNLVPLSEFVSRHLQGRSTCGLVAITFDDAYLSLDAGLREFVGREGVPIAIFVVTRAAETGRSFWWDRIDDALPRVTPERWRAFEAACGMPDDYRRGQPAEYGPLRPLRQWLLARYAGRWPAHLEPELLALEADSGWRGRHRPMTYEELEPMAAMPEVELGVHTVSHPVLPLLPDADLRDEIRSGYAELRERFPAVLPILAVPFGLFDRRTIRAGSEAGMMASLTLAGTISGREADREAVPRVCVSRSDTTTKLLMQLVGVPTLARRLAGRNLEYPALPSSTT